MNILFFLRHLAFVAVIFGLAALLTRYMVRHLTIFDVPNERSSHTKKTPRGGGVAIVASFLLGITLIHLIGDRSPIYSRYFIGFLVAAGIVAAISFYDDFRYCSFKIKLASQIGAVCFAIWSGILIDKTYMPWIGMHEWGLLGYPLTFLWIMGMINAYNFFDGLDGLAAGSAAIAAAFFSFIAYQHGSLFIYLASMTLSAATLGFLIFNLSPAKIFMGDVGSTFLGLVFALMAIIAARYDHSHTSLFVIPLLLLHIIFDTSFTFFRRLLRGDNVFHPHRLHIYQLLNRLGYSHGEVAMVYSGLAVVQGFAAIWMMNNIGEKRLFIFVPFVFIYAACVGWVLDKAKKTGLT